jgi:hypothetical protein
MSLPKSLEKAVQMASRFREKRETILVPEIRDAGILPVCETFYAKDIQRILNQPGCVKLRVYFGMDDKQRVHPIIIGADDQDADILPSENVIESMATELLPTLDITEESARTGSDFSDILV